MNAMSARKHPWPRLLLLGSLWISTGLTAHPELPETGSNEANRQLVINFYQKFFNDHQLQAAAVLVDDYRQHNPGVPDGKAPFLHYFQGWFRQHPQARARIIRSATDGDLVYLHVHSIAGPGDRGRAIVDIFRVRNQRIVEHWDVIQNVPAVSANDNTMF